MLISKGNSLEKGMLGTNRGILAKIHLIFYKNKLVCYANGQCFFLSECRLNLF